MSSSADLPKGYLRRLHGEVQPLARETANPKSEYFVREEQARYGVAEDRDEYLADNIFGAAGSALALLSRRTPSALRSARWWTTP